MGKKKDDMDIDELLKETINSDNSPIIPTNFVDRLTRKFEIRTTRRLLLNEWGLKLMVLFIICFSLIGTFFYVDKEEIASLINKDNIVYILIGLTVLFVFFFDQVILKLMFFRRDLKNNQLNN